MKTVTRNEMVLYYSPRPQSYAAKLKGVLVRMGVRIRNIGQDQTGQTVGYLAGMPGFEETKVPELAEGQETPELAEGQETPELAEGQGQPEKQNQSAAPADEMLVMKNFTSRRIDELLINLRKAGVPKIALKAIITEENSKWTFYRLYEELKEEHAAMSGQPAEEPAAEPAKQRGSDETKQPAADMPEKDEA